MKVSSSKYPEYALKSRRNSGRWPSGSTSRSVAQEVYDDFYNFI
jgi:hypothetical protein